MQPKHNRENDYIILNGGDDKAPLAPENRFPVRSVPSKAQIAAWEREIIATRQQEAEKDMVCKKAELAKILAEMDAAENLAEIEYAASIIQPKLQYQKICRLIESLPDLKRAKSLWDWAQMRAEGKLKAAAEQGFFILAGQDAEKILSLPKLEETLQKMVQDNALRREECGRQREHVCQTHEQMIQHLEILRADSALRAYDREILEKRIQTYQSHGIGKQAVPAPNSVFSMVPHIERPQDVIRNFTTKQ